MHWFGDMSRRELLEEIDRLITTDKPGLAKLYERNAALQRALADVIDVATWMSGSPSFAAEGEAGEYWKAQRERLYAAMLVRDAA